MDLKHIQLVMIDLDGTLLNHKKECSQITKDTIKKLLDKNIKVCIATGRAYRDSKHIVEQCGIMDCVSTVNGACIHENGKIIHTEELGKDIVEEISNYAREINEFMWLYTKGDVYHETTNELYDALVSNYPFFTSTERNFDEIDSILKGLFLARMDVAKIIKERLSKNPNLAILFTIPSVDDPQPPHEPLTYVEILNKSTNKGSALKWLSEYYNIPKENILAFGDEDNDIEMLTNAGFAVAMGNAKPNVKEIADFITLSNDENGVSDFIEKYIL